MESKNQLFTSPIRSVIALKNKYSMTCPSAWFTSVVGNTEIYISLTWKKVGQCLHECVLQVGSLLLSRNAHKRQHLLKGVWSDHLWILPSKWSFWYQMIESPYFSHYACEILHETYVACKSYKRKCSDSSVTTIITIHEFSLVTSKNQHLVAIIFYRVNEKNRGFLLVSKYLFQ